MAMIAGDVWKFLVIAGLKGENGGGKGLDERNLEKVEQVRGTGEPVTWLVVGQFSGCLHPLRLSKLQVSNKKIRYVLVSVNFLAASKISFTQLENGGCFSIERL